MLTIKEVYNNIYKKLLIQKFLSPQVDTEVIICKSLNLTKTHIYTYPQEVVSKKQIELINKNLSHRLKYKPIAYIFNEKEFFGLNFYVDENVLIPRPETEILVEETIKLINKNKLKSFVDVGTGSGNIVISIVKNLSFDIISYATDISSKVLKVAKINAKIHNVFNKINFILTDKLKYFIEKNIKLDLIVSNPPYVSEEEYKSLQKEIYYEPKRALVVKKGIEFYEYFATYGRKVLNENGYLILEINSNLVREICDLFKKFGYKIIKIINDYQNLPRVVMVRI